MFTIGPFAVSQIVKISNQIIVHFFMGKNIDEDIIALTYYFLSFFFLLGLY